MILGLCALSALFGVFTTKAYTWYVILPRERKAAYGTGYTEGYRDSCRAVDGWHVEMNL